MVGARHVVPTVLAILALGGCDSDQGAGTDHGAASDQDASDCSQLQGVCCYAGNTGDMWSCPAATPDCVVVPVGSTFSSSVIVGVCQGPLDSTSAPSCTSDSDCAGVAAACVGLQDGFGHGYCSRTCDPLGPYDPGELARVTTVEAFDNCGALGICEGDGWTPIPAQWPGSPVSACRQACGAPGQTCRTGYACARNPAPTPADRSLNGEYWSAPWGRPDVVVTSASSPTGVCLPHCSSDADCSGGGCNRYTGRCGSTDLSLQDNGQACTAASDCRSGACFVATSQSCRFRGGCSTSQTGYSDGMCVGVCAPPDPSVYASGTVNVADCAAGSVCVPLPDASAGDLSVCLPHCSADSDCRSDYVCVHPHLPGRTDPATDGFCDSRVDPLAQL